jgi:hypothetical protein
MNGRSHCGSFDEKASNIGFDAGRSVPAPAGYDVTHISETIGCSQLENDFLSKKSEKFRFQSVREIVRNKLVGDHRAFRCFLHLGKVLLETVTVVWLCRVAS